MRFGRSPHRANGGGAPRAGGLFVYRIVSCVYFLSLLSFLTPLDCRLLFSTAVLLPFSLRDMSCFSSLMCCARAVGGAHCAVWRLGLGPVLYAERSNVFQPLPRCFLAKSGNAPWKPPRHRAQLLYDAEVHARKGGKKRNWSGAFPARIPHAHAQTKLPAVRYTPPTST